jgi:hypothetical protein
VHAVVLFRGSKGRYLVTTRHGTMDFFGVRSEKVSSLRSAPRLYISENEAGAVAAELQSSAEELMMASDAMSCELEKSCQLCD